MIFTPAEVPHSCHTKLTDAFPQSQLKGDPDLKNKVDFLVMIRNKFWDWVKDAQENASYGKETWELDIGDVKRYLDQGPELLTLLAKKAECSLKITYKTSLNENMKELVVSDIII